MTLLLCLLITVLSSAVTRQHKVLCPLLCPPGYESPRNCSSWSDHRCVQCPEGYHKSIDDQSEGFATICVENNPCDSIGQYVKSTDKINGVVCACTNGYFPDPSDISDPCKYCYCCDDRNTSLEQGCLTSTIKGAYCRHGAGLSDCEGTPTPRTTTKMVTTDLTTSTSVKMTIEMVTPPTRTSVKMTTTKLMSHSQQAPLNGYLKSGDYTKEVVSTVVVLVVFVIAIVVAVVCVRRKHGSDLSKLNDVLQQKSFEVVDPKSGKSTSIVYGLPIEYQSNFGSDSELQAQKKRDLLEQIKASKCSRDECVKNAQYEDKRDEFHTTETAADYRDDGTCAIPFMPLQQCNSPLEESLVQFESHGEDIAHNTIVEDQVVVVLESPSQPAVEEARPCLSHNPSTTSTFHRRCTVHSQGYGERIAKQRGIRRALFADHSMWDLSLGLLSAEDHRNMAYWYYGLADFKYETDPGEESWLIALPTDVLWQLSVRLDVPDHPPNYRHLAGYFIDDQVVVEYLQVEYLRWFGSPTLKLLKTLMAQEPPITIEVLKQKLLLMGRSDCADLLSPYVPAQGSFPVSSRSSVFRQRSTRETGSEGNDEPLRESRDPRREFLDNDSHDHLHIKMNSGADFQTSGNNSEEELVNDNLV